MLKLLRYTLAAIFLAASVGCMALWVVSLARSGVYDDAVLRLDGSSANAELYDGVVVVWLDSGDKISGWDVQSYSPFSRGRARYEEVQALQGRFGSVDSNAVYSPLWYPAVVFALAAAGSLRFGQRFTIRSALIVTAVVAALLGMVVAL